MSKKNTEAWLHAVDAESLADEIGTGSDIAKCIDLLGDMHKRLARKIATARRFGGATDGELHDALIVKSRLEQAVKPLKKIAKDFDNFYLY